MTKLNEGFKHERLLEQAGMANISSCYRDHANPVQCKRGVNGRAGTATDMNYKNPHDMKFSIFVRGPGLCYFLLNKQPKTLSQQYNRIAQCRVAQLLTIVVNNNVQH